MPFRHERRDKRQAFFTAYGNEDHADHAPRYRVVAKIEAAPQPLVLGSTVEARIIIRRVALRCLLFHHRPEA